MACSKPFNETDQSPHSLAHPRLEQPGPKKKKLKCPFPGAIFNPLYVAERRPKNEQHGPNGKSKFEKYLRQLPSCLGPILNKHSILLLGSSRYRTKMMYHKKLN